MVGQSMHRMFTSTPQVRHPRSSQPQKEQDEERQNRFESKRPHFTPPSSARGARGMELSSEINSREGDDGYVFVYTTKKPLSCGDMSGCAAQGQTSEAGTLFREAMEVVFSHGFIHDKPLYASLRDLQLASLGVRDKYQSAAARIVRVTTETHVSRGGTLTPWVVQETDDLFGALLV